jgi:hypothetical protein
LVRVFSHSLLGVRTDLRYLSVLVIASFGPTRVLCDLSSPPIHFCAKTLALPHALFSSSPSLLKHPLLPWMLTLPTDSEPAFPCTSFLGARPQRYEVLKDKVRSFTFFLSVQVVGVCLRPLTRSRPLSGASSAPRIVPPDGGRGSETGRGEKEEAGQLCALRFCFVGELPSPSLPLFLCYWRALTRIFRARRSISSRMGAFIRMGCVTPPVLSSLLTFRSARLISLSHPTLVLPHVLGRWQAFKRPLSTRRTYSFFGRWTIVHRLGIRRVRVRARWSRGSSVSDARPGCVRRNAVDVQKGTAHMLPTGGARGGRAGARQ